jgi:hypothetical protein
VEGLSPPRRGSTLLLRELRESGSQLGSREGEENAHLERRLPTGGMHEVDRDRLNIEGLQTVDERPSTQGIIAVAAIRTAEASAPRGRLYCAFR